MNFTYDVQQFWRIISFKLKKKIPTKIRAYVRKRRRILRFVFLGYSFGKRVRIAANNRREYGRRGSGE